MRGRLRVNGGPCLQRCLISECCMQQQESDDWGPKKSSAKAKTRWQLITHADQAFVTHCLCWVGSGSVFRVTQHALWLALSVGSQDFLPVIGCIAHRCYSAHLGYNQWFLELLLLFNGRRPICPFQLLLAGGTKLCWTPSTKPALWGN